jgi:hypothetical protein
VSLNDELNDEAAANEEDAGPLWRAEWNGDEGTIQTGAVADSFNPNDFSSVLKELGYEPGEIGMELVAATRWEQRSARRKWSDQYNAYIRTDEWERVWLNAYRYKAVRNAFTVNLPALYAEVGKTKRKQLKQATAESTVVVCWADIQVGKTDHLGGLQELLERLDEKRAALATYLKRQEFDRIIVADVGDIVEGFDNVGAQTHTNCLSLMDQVDVAATEFWKAISLCAKYAPVDVLSIPSNHGQWRKGKDLVGKPTDDWGLHINRRLERHNEEAGLRATFHRPADWCESLTFDVRGTRLGLAHGHQATSPDGVKTWWGKMTHAGVLDCHVLLTGHFHFASLRPHGKDAQTGRSRWHIQASTLDNGSAWVRNKMGEDGDPALTVFQINADGFDPSSFALL